MKRVLKFTFIALGLFLIYQFSMIFIKGFYVKDEKQTLSSDHFDIHFHQVN